MTVFVDSDKYMDRAMAILDVVGNLRLLGETGTGKTTLVHHMARKYGWTLFEYSLNTDVSRWDLIASEVLRNGTSEVRKGIVLQWLESEASKDSWAVLYLDELNYASSGVLTLLNQLSDFRESIYVPELGKEYKRTKWHKIVVAMNPSEKAGYSGTFNLNIALVRRFETLVVDYLPVFHEVEILKKAGASHALARRLVEFAWKTRKLYQEGELSTLVTTGNLINYVKLLEAGLEDRDIIEIASAMFMAEERRLVQELWENLETDGGDSHD